MAALLQDDVELLMENMLMPVAGFAVFVSTVLPRGFGERMQTRVHARVRCVACWRGVAGQHAATAGVHSAGKKIFFWSADRQLCTHADMPSAKDN